MCWADRIGVLWGAVAYAGLFVLSNDKAAVVAFYFSAEGLKFLLIICLLPWIFLRLIDWVAGGPSRRRGIISGQIVR